MKQKNLKHHLSSAVPVHELSVVNHPGMHIGLGLPGLVVVVWAFGLTLAALFSEVPLKATARRSKLNKTTERFEVRPKLNEWFGFEVLIFGSMLLVLLWRRVAIIDYHGHLHRLAISFNLVLDLDGK